MFIARATKNNLVLEKKETITSGSVQVYKVKFDFDDAWKDEYKRYAIFKVGSYSTTIPLDENNSCEIPWELLLDKYKNLVMYLGVQGRMEDGTVVLPTGFLEIGKIVEGAKICDNMPRPNSPSIYDEVLERLDDKGDSLFYDEEASALSLRSGQNTISTVVINGGGGAVENAVQSEQIHNMVVMDRESYDKLEVKDQNTLYFIMG